MEILREEALNRRPSEPLNLIGTEHASAEFLERE
jgi:hypothetical protein